MNKPNNYAITKNGIALYSNRMSNYFGIHSYITEEKKVKTERIESKNFPNQKRTNYLKYIILFSIPFSFVLSFNLFQATIIGRILFGLSLFSYLFLQCFYELCENWKKIKEYPKLYSALEAILKLDYVPNENYFKQNYIKKFYYLIFIISFVIASEILLYVPLLGNNASKVSLYLIICLFISCTISLVLYKLHFEKLFEKFFFFSPTDIEFEIVWKGIIEWNELEDELLENSLRE